jgi:para-aminobenzoate synthetase/4-amino-4-deoxychorismate lyase
LVTLGSSRDSFTEEGKAGAEKATVAFPSADGTALTFRRPLRVHAARRLEEILPALAAAEAALVDGHWVSGFVTYEAAPAFDPAFVTREPGALPLLWLGVFEPPRRERLPAAPPLRLDELRWQPSMERADYSRAVSAVRAAIAAGDTYQVNLTWRLHAPFEGDPGALFAALLGAQQVPHAAWVDLGRHVLCSASPELLFRQRGETLLTRPMKGTARRGRWPAEDAAAAAALTASAKERAENVMIVDMTRNDLARVAAAGSVAVRRLCVAERYATVWQLTSTVTARTEASPFAVLAALFPGASITGAPKASTMRHVAALETAPRGVYTGSIGWVSPSRRARWNVAIRTAWVDREAGTVEYGTGGGVTWDSRAPAELAESRLKAAVLLAPRPRFELLETLRWRPRAGYWLLQEHLDRLASSARHFGFRWPGGRAVRAALEARAVELPRDPHRVRAFLAANGGLRLEAQPEPRRPRGPRRPWQLGIASEPIDETDVFLFHKTTWREPYERARVGVDGDDVLLWNRRGELTESTLANLVVELDGRLVTPPVSSGLLAGTFRARLLARKRIVEAVVTLRDLPRASRLWLINSVRGWIPAQSSREPIRPSEASPPPGMLEP